MVGIDEVGRGAWAGPLLVCAVRLRNPLAGLKDSKQLTKNKRRQLSETIKLNADIGYGWVSAQTIDRLGLSAATRLAVNLAIDDVAPAMDEEIIIDGNINYLPSLNAKAIIKADQKIAAVSAASIVAKVSRDEHMFRLTETLPDYGFDKHVGYGTSLHLEAIKQHGLSDQHRKSFKPCQLYLKRTSS